MRNSDSLQDARILKFTVSKGLDQLLVKWVADRLVACSHRYELQLSRFRSQHKVLGSNELTDWAIY